MAWIVAPPQPPRQRWASLRMRPWPTAWPSAAIPSCDRCQAAPIDDYLLSQGQECVAAEAGRVAEGRALCILDGSVLEKPESAVAEGLRPVRSSKARRLARPRPKLGPGYYRGKPGGPIVVPGCDWLGVVVTGWAAQAERRPVTLGAWHWYAHPPADGPDPAPAPAAVPYQRTP